MRKLFFGALPKPVSNVYKNSNTCCGIANYLNLTHVMWGVNPNYGGILGDNSTPEISSGC